MTRDQILTDAFERLTKSLMEKDIAAARAVLADLLDQPPPDDPAELHRQRLAEIGDDTVQLARYLGELGILVNDVKLRLGREMNDDEKSEYKRGAADRRLELRALELAAVRRGQKLNVPDWMKQ